MPRLWVPEPDTALPDAERVPALAKMTVVKVSPLRQIGRASCGERAEMSEVAVSLEEKKLGTVSFTFSAVMVTPMLLKAELWSIKSLVVTVTVSVPALIL